MKTLIDEARELAANERVTDADLRTMVSQHSRAAELALEMRQATSAPEADAIGVPVLW